MPFLRSLKKTLSVDKSEKKRKKKLVHITEGVDPLSKWEILGDLGDGAFGKVHRARSLESGREAAVKICEAEDEEELAELAGEVEIHAGLQHTNILQLYVAFTHRQQLWIFTEAVCSSIDSRGGTVVKSLEDWSQC